MGKGIAVLGIVAAAVRWISGSSEMGVSAAERQYRKKFGAQKSPCCSARASV
ncbi:hypothetical protein OKW96_14585 [Sphingobacterium sp. KU25419]|nr:hypothetical protein OKW96_14585 [Sphingobacterium sp. KU25419]